MPTSVSRPQSRPGTPTAPSRRTTSCTAYRSLRRATRRSQPCWTNSHLCCDVWSDCASRHCPAVARSRCTLGSSTCARRGSERPRPRCPTPRGRPWHPCSTPDPQTATPLGDPMSIHDFKRYPLTFGPSPIHPLKRLSAHLGGAQVWAKREDCNSGLAFGGNKTRKLEYIVPDALAQGADTLVSIGGYQSNHTRQVAAVAAHLGLKCRLVQEKWVPWDDPTNTQVGNILLSRMMGADSRLDPHGFDIGIRDSWRDAIREVEESGGTPYAIPAGASEHRLGGLGFANWAFEVAEQEKALGITFDTIVVCTVTGSTHAGMIAGFAALEDLTGVRRRVIGIDASATLEKTRAQLERIARHTAEVIELGRDLRDDEFTLLDGWAGELYGVPVDSTMEAMRLGAELEAMITDPVYEGKSLAGLVDLVREGDIPRDSTVLYAHLGGQPALNAYHSLWPAS